MADVLQILPQQLVFGLALGTVYGLIALGYTLVYGILFMINFAHGEIFMIGAYVGWWVLSWLLQAQVGGLHPAWVVPLMLVHAMLFTGLLGVLLERFAYRPLYIRGAPRLGPLISALGAYIFLGPSVGGGGGVLVGLYYTQIGFFMGYAAGLKAFTAAVLGGIGNIRGAMLGGLILGLIESLAVTFMNPAYKDVVAFAILILTLVFKPTGILGETVCASEEG